MRAHEASCVVFPKLKASTRTISIRLPESLIEEGKVRPAAEVIKGLRDRRKDR
ncbi:MAG: hypothetical protein HGA78_09495 [Nitrospirales bacterium]|nr:hypothetical protein [Nitrospirales bacterium]